MQFVKTIKTIILLVALSIFILNCWSSTTRLCLAKQSQITFPGRYHSPEGRARRRPPLQPCPTTKIFMLKDFDYRSPEFLISPFGLNKLAKIWIRNAPYKLSGIDSTVISWFNNGLEAKTQAGGTASLEKLLRFSSFDSLSARRKLYFGLIGIYCVCKLSNSCYSSK